MDEIPVKQPIGSIRLDDKLIEVSGPIDWVETQIDRLTKKGVKNEKQKTK